jgi:hypothetical protein
MPGASFAEAICWIGHITKAEGGVNVYFNAFNLEVGTGRRFIASTSSVFDIENRTTQDHLFIKDGSKLFAFQSHHDFCHYSVSSDGAVGKVIAVATMRMPGLPAQSATQIIRTDGTVSAPERRRLDP